MYSAFSERSPSAAASESAFTTSGRRTFQRSLNSSRRRSYPARVMIAVERSGGGRQRDIASALPAAEQAAQHATHDLSAQAGGHGARSRLCRRFHRALAALGSPQEF